MAISGALGLIFFLIANFTQALTGLNFLAGCIQIAINVFVFLSWKRGFLESGGLAKFVALVGTVVPVVMALITIVRVIIPSIFN